MQVELGNLNCSFDCRCNTKHREYFKTTKAEAKEVLDFWGGWLKSKPYDNRFQLLPFWQDRLRLLGGDELEHDRCSSPECQSSTDLLASLCQACLRLRLVAWVKVTPFDLFEYECRTKIPSKPIRQLILKQWPHRADVMMTLLALWGALSARRTHSYLLLFVALDIIPRVPSGFSAPYAVMCLVAHWWFAKGYNELADLDQPAKESTDRKPTGGAPKTPQKEVIAESVEMSENFGSRKTRSVSIGAAIDVSSRHDAETPSKMVDRSAMFRTRAHTLSPNSARTRAVDLAGKKIKQIRTKRRKSDLDITA